MAARENIFIRTDRSVPDAAALLSALLGLEQIPDDDDSAEDVGLRGRAESADGFLGFRVMPNANGLPDPDPDEIQAIDGYPLQVDIWYGSKEPEVQRREARIVFDKLTAAGSDVAMLLTSDLQYLIAAYVPGAGVHEFEPATTMDAPDVERWRPWVAV
jgi:hypothetical protein